MFDFDLTHKLYLNPKKWKSCWFIVRNTFYGQFSITNVCYLEMCSHTSTSELRCATISTALLRAILQWTTTTTRITLLHWSVEFGRVDNQVQFRVFRQCNVARHNIRVVDLLAKWNERVMWDWFQCVCTRLWWRSHGAHRSTHLGQVASRMWCDVMLCCDVSRDTHSNLSLGPFTDRLLWTKLKDNIRNNIVLLQ